MAKIKKKTSTKRFGARYGRTLKEKFGVIEKEQRKKHKCPYCNKEKVKRITAGIWECRKCGAKFTGRAYTLVKKKIIRLEEGEELEELGKEKSPEEEVEK